MPLKKCQVSINVTSKKVLIGTCFIFLSLSDMYVQGTKPDIRQNTQS